VILRFSKQPSDNFTQKSVNNLTKLTM